MQRIRLIHWNADEAEERASRLRSAGYAVDHDPLTPARLRALREDPPDAVVIDLGRLPSQGRDVAVDLRISTATRPVPLLFVGGEPEKVARVRELLPDAVYSDWDRIERVLPDAIAHPPDDPVVPPSRMAGYSGTPLPKKLGIKAGSAVTLVNAPQDFEETLGELPPGVVIGRQATGQPDVTLWFVRSQEDLKGNIQRMDALAAKGRLWIMWPKKASGIVSDLTQNVVRQVGLAVSLVDFKVAAIDATWSGLCFTRRKTN
jgi:hypothetical protein